MSGYTVFLGPFAGIMITDVRHSSKHPCSLPHLTSHLSVLARPSLQSRRSRDVQTSWSLSLHSGFVRILHSFNSGLVFNLIISLELASRSSNPRLSPTQPPRSHQLHQSQDSRRRCSIPLRLCLAPRGEYPTISHSSHFPLYHTFSI